ncbi:Rv2175c family DNA-binding protein [Pseudonocardia sp. NPDC049154]|uniref:Rv2175c family DNA-binding protein n=1 Tax=Pseudonocardia sp. NPDC049154 TaxID=3155501 RepID=UPI0033DE60B3
MVTRVSETNGTTPVLSDDVAVLPATEVAEILSVPRTRVHQLIKDGQLLSLRREGTTCVPADFLDGNAVVKGLSGTITVLRDGGYPDTDILRWLFTEDESLPGTPIAAIRAGRHREIKRRAQAMAF